MRRELKVSASAADQIRAANRWWRNNRDLPELFAEEIERGFGLLTSDPRIGSAASPRIGIRDLRRLHLPRIRYFLYYRIDADDRVEVLALWHTSRGSSPQLREDEVHEA